MQLAHRLSFLVLLGSLSLTSAFANSEVTGPIEKFEYCVSMHLLNRFMPGHGNRYSYSTPGTRVHILEGERESAPAKISFVPSWNAYSDQVGQFETRTGRRQYQKVTELRATGNSKTGDQSVGISYKHWMRSGDPDDSNGDVNVRLLIASGLPFLTAEMVTKKNCQIDEYGRKICDEPTVRFSNFKVEVPKSYQPQVYWVNSETGNRTNFPVTMSAYLSCLQQIK
jgi:hypothetical protein